MAADVVPQLNEAIQTSFRTNVMKDRRIAQISQRIRDGTATFVDGHDYAERLGENLSKALKDNLTAQTLPDGRLYYNIAKRTVTPALEENYELTNEIAADIQKILDAKQNIGLGAVKADFPKERIQGLIDKMTTEGITLEDALKWLAEPIINNSEAFFDDFIDSNAKFRSQVGLKAKIIRKVEPGACEWCRALAGEYDVADGMSEFVHENIYRRHEFCRCAVIYETSKERQDVWSKRTWQTSAEDLAKRKNTGQTLELTPAERLEAANRVYRDTVIQDKYGVGTMSGTPYERRQKTKAFSKLTPEERVERYNKVMQRRAQGKG